MGAHRSPGYRRGVPHRSRLVAIGIDVPADVHEQTAAFWAGALGATATPDEDGTYAHLEGVERPIVFVQRLGDGPARLHVDVETDDVPAEVARLEALGATRVRAVST